MSSAALATLPTSPRWTYGGAPSKSVTSSRVFLSSASPRGGTLPRNRLRPTLLQTPLPLPTLVSLAKKMASNWGNQQQHGTFQVILNAWACCRYAAFLARTFQFPSDFYRANLLIALPGHQTNAIIPPSKLFRWKDMTPPLLNLKFCSNLAIKNNSSQQICFRFINSIFVGTSRNRYKFEELRVKIMWLIRGLRTTCSTLQIPTLIVINECYFFVNTIYLLSLTPPFMTRLPKLGKWLQAVRFSAFWRQTYH